MASRNVVMYAEAFVFWRNAFARQLIALLDLVSPESALPFWCEGQPRPWAVAMIPSLENRILPASRGITTRPLVVVAV